MVKSRNHAIFSHQASCVFNVNIRMPERRLCTRKSIAKSQVYSEFCTINILGIMSHNVVFIACWKFLTPYKIESIAIHAISIIIILKCHLGRITSSNIGFWNNKIGIGHKTMGANKIRLIKRYADFRCLCGGVCCCSFNG